MTSPPAGLCVILVANYEDDRQQSMLRFANLLHTELSARGVNVQVLTPAPWAGRFAKSGSPFAGLRKWLGYVDKYLIFPWLMRRRLRALAGGDADGRHVVHICDHSNAMYGPPAATALGSGHRLPVLVTCHDLGAVRGAFGEAGDTFCPASATGKILQAWIARTLGRADRIACVSTSTKADVERLIRTPKGALPDARVIFMGQNAPYGRLSSEVAEERLRRVDSANFESTSPFLLHVGSSLTRKNRDGVLRIFARLKDRWPEGRLLFAGEPLGSDLLQMAGDLGVAERVIQVAGPSNDLLEALYNKAFALLFPSRFEGFGWPVIEAQACGCPVLCSDAGSLGEVAGAGAFVRKAGDEAAFAEELSRLLGDPARREEWVRRGYENLSRFTTKRMIQEYLDLYRELIAARSKPAPGAASRNNLLNASPAPV